MNSELYFPRNGKSFSKTSEMDFEDTVKLLGDIDINIIYKTEISLTKESFTDALEESSGGSEKIHLIVVADAFSDPDPDKVHRLLSDLGVEGKIKKIMAPVADLDAILENSRKNDKITPLMPTLKIDDGESSNTDDNEQTVNLMQPKPSDSQNTEPETKKITAYSTVYNDILVVFLPEEKSVDENFNTILYSVTKNILKPKSKPKFWQRFIPCSGDSPFDVIRKVVLMLAICTFIVSSCMLVNLLVVKPAINDNQNNQIREMLVVGEDEYDDNGQKITKKPTDGSEGTLVDFSKLVKENDDTVGWIKVPNTKIDYVVCQAPKDYDHEYYLYRDFYENYDTYGTVFMDYRSSLDSKNMILHGHNMRDGRMFGTLKYYEDFDFYKKNPTFTFNTIYEKSEWKIISIMKTNTLESQGEFFNYLRGDFESSYDFLNFIYQIRERSIIDTPVTANENDTLVTLSTCTYDFSEFRFVVIARKVRDGEDTNVDVSKAKENPDTLYPDVWYRTYGGSKPDVTTFQEAYNNKAISWYDGKKKDWSEKDDEKLLEELKEGKEKAIQEMKNFIAKNQYAENEQKQIDKLLEDYTKLIESAKSRSEINDIFNKGIEDIRKVKTLEALNSEIEESNKAATEQELAEKKATAKTDLHNSVSGNTYRTTQSLQVNDLFDEYNEKIDNAENVEEVEKLKKEGIEKLKKIKTNDQLAKEESEDKAKKQASEESSRAAEASRRAEEASKAAEASRRAEEASKAAEASRRAEANRELLEQKNNATSSIANYVDLNNYKTEQQNEISSIINEYRTLINNASTASAINSYVSAAKNKIGAVKTAAQIDAEISHVQESSYQESPEPPVEESSEPQVSEETSIEE